MRGRSFLLRLLLGSWLAACVLALAGAAPAWLYRTEDLDLSQMVLEWVAVAALLGLVALSGLGLLLDPVVLIVVLCRRRPASLVWLAPLTLPSVLLAGTLGAIRLSPVGVWRARDAAFRALAERSEALTRAIDCYRADHGRAPAMLEELVPRYLPAVPGTGLDRYPRYDYRVFEGGSGAVGLLWYDLGPSRDTWLDDWRYDFLGPLESSILVVLVDAEGRIVGTDTDRLGAKPAQQVFDAGRWHGDPARRASMVDDLRATLVGRPVDDMTALLGPEGGAEDMPGHFSGAPFELTVPCSIGLLNWDVFVYWPSEEYPDHMYGGWVERVEGWAYVHE